MTTGIEYDTSYKKAYTAYVQGKLEEAAALVELLAGEYPDDPNILLLQGHICLNRQQYAVARQCYESVLAKSQQQDLDDCARQGLAQLEEWQQAAEIAAPQDFMAAAPAMTPVAEETDRATIQSGMDDLNWDSNISHLLEDAGDNTIPNSEAGLSFTNEAEHWSTLAKSSSINIEEESFLKQLDLSHEELSELYQLGAMEVSPELRELTDLPTAEFSELLDQHILESEIKSQDKGVRIKEDLADSSFLPAQPKNRWLNRFVNASLYQKQLLVAAAAGLAPVLAILIFSGATWLFSPKQPLPKKSQPAPVAQFSLFREQEGWLLLLAGGSSFGTALLLGQLAARQAKRGLENLEDCFLTISQGNLNTRATVYSTDEIGQLAASFNEFWEEIATTAGKAEHRASEMEQAKEQLQRQVINLLDEVEGASKGDLTVEAKVTADILGAVADAFNLTIQNLREILQQVKQAAKQVNQAATDSASFARKNSQESLRMAGELAFTLQSVEMMNESIQRVAESAKEAENVAHTASVTALKGGQAVELTVTGVMSIRETVSDTARKVKRLAEASQEISKIVAAISQISSRTNLLALNASLQAARAGEAGRGFAVVADEVRQLADRSAKSLKEIEQIVVQIQGETSSVMAAMEEGIQQVLDVSEKSEQAKSALDAIIEVSNHIDQLLQSITADTIQQKENSQSVAQFMQSVEITAQTTSQESQRVAGSLQKLVSISHDLLASVNKFRLET